MNTVAAWFKKISLSKIFSVFDTDGIIITVVVALGAIFLLVLLFDGLIFYRTVLAAPERAAPEQRLLFPEKELRDVLKLLEIRGVGTGVTTSTSTIPRTSK